MRIWQKIRRFLIFLVVTAVFLLGAAIVVHHDMLWSAISGGVESMITAVIGVAVCLWAIIIMFRIIL